MMLEAKYRRELVNRLKQIFPTCFILTLDPAENQGVPDILLLFKNRWAMLEVKMSRTAEHQPNQDYYIEMFNRMSFASFIYPEIEEQVLDDLQHALGSCR